MDVFSTNRRATAHMYLVEHPCHLRHERRKLKKSCETIRVLSEKCVLAAYLVKIFPPGRLLNTLYVAIYNLNLHALFILSENHHLALFIVMTPCFLAA